MLFGDKMKKNANILEYVEKYKYKYGISYANEDGRLVKTLSVISYIVWIYTFFMTALFVFSTCFMFKFGAVDFDYIANAFITISVGAFIMIVGAALYLCKQKIIGCAANAFVQPFMILAYSHLTRNSAGIINFSFYWRHAIPAAILFCLALWIMAVLIRANIKTTKLYNMLVDGLYKQYGKKDGETLTEEQWQEFLNQYNPYKKIT